MRRPLPTRSTTRGGRAVAGSSGAVSAGEAALPGTSLEGLLMGFDMMAEKWDIAFMSEVDAVRAQRRTRVRGCWAARHWPGEGSMVFVVKARLAQSSMKQVTS